MSLQLPGFEKESPWNSSLNLAHYHGRLADKHLKHGRYDEAIESHKETVRLLTKAMDESTILKNVEHLELQRKYHENYQRIIQRQKLEFERYMRRKEANAVKKKTNIRENNGNALRESASLDGAVAQQNGVERGIVIVSDLMDDNNDNDDFFSLVTELKHDHEAEMSILAVTAINISEDSCDDDEYLSCHELNKTEFN